MLEKLKQKVIDTSIKAEDCGLCKHKSGNFSIRDKETGYVLITPSAIDRKLLTVDDICVIDLNGKNIEVKKDRRPSSEALMHLQIYKLRDDINSVAHTHSKFATAFAVLNKSIPSIIYEAAVFGLGEGIPVAKYARPGTVELAESVIEPLKKAEVFLLEKHGVVSVGKDIDDAFLKVQYAEEFAEIYYRALQINNGKEPAVFKADELGAWVYPEELTKK